MKEALLNIIGNKFILYGLIVVIVLFILIVIMIKLSGNDNHFEKAERLHEEAENLHVLGNEEKAERLLEKAEEIRQKARESENGE